MTLRACEFAQSRKPGMATKPTGGCKRWLMEGGRRPKALDFASSLWNTLDHEEKAMGVKQTKPSFIILPSAATRSFPYLDSPKLVLGKRRNPARHATVVFWPWRFHELEATQAGVRTHEPDSPEYVVCLESLSGACARRSIVTAETALSTNQIKMKIMCLLSSDDPPSVRSELGGRCILPGADRNLKVSPSSQPKKGSA